MKYAWLVAVLICLSLTGAWAELDRGLFTARALGMGNATLGVADDAAAWYQNPAGLAELNVAPRAEKTWASDLIGTYGNFDQGAVANNSWGLHYSGWQPAKSRGLGFGYGDLNNVSAAMGIGIGTMVKETPLSIGLNFMNTDPENGGSQSTFDLGFMYRFEQPERPALRLAATVHDLFDQTDIGPRYNMGVYWPATTTTALAVDMLDISDETGWGPYFNAGIELKLGQTKEWAFRAGVADSGTSHDFTVGAGFARDNWRFDAGYVDLLEGEVRLSGGIQF